MTVVVTEYQDYVNSTDIYPLYDGNYIHNLYYTYKTELINALIKIINYAPQILLDKMVKHYIDLQVIKIIMLNGAETYGKTLILILNRINGSILTLNLLLSMPNQRKFSRSNCLGLEF